MAQPTHRESYGDPKPFVISPPWSSARVQMSSSGLAGPPTTARERLWGPTLANVAASGTKPTWTIHLN